MRREQTVTFMLANNPTLVGAVTVLVTAVAVFLSYNAQKGLPFVPTFSVTAEVRDANGLIPGNEVVIGGRRVGIVDSIEAELGEQSKPVARVVLKLDAEVEGQVRDDAVVRIRPASLFELKYVSLEPGHGDPLPEGGVIPVEQSRTNINLADAFSVFDAPTRRNLQRVLTGVGNGVAGRGADFNSALARLPALLRDAQPVLADLADPRTHLGRLFRSFARVAAEVAPASSDLASLLDNGEITLAALEAAGPELEATLERLPGSFESGTEALAGLRSPLAKARRLAVTLRPAAPLLAPTSRHLAEAVEAGIGVLRRAIPVGEQLRSTLSALRSVARAPLEPALRKLAHAAPKLRKSVDYMAPYQTVCNYGGLLSRNVPSAFSEGTATGNWLRYVLLIRTEETLQSPSAAGDLHFDPYPNGGAPGQTRECEIGNEVYLPGRQIGNIPGNQGTETEQTSGGLGG